MLDPTKILVGIPEGLRLPLIVAYREIQKNYTEHRWEPSELNGGKFSEAVFWVLHGAISGAFAGAPTKPKNMVDACRALEKHSPNAALPGDRSLRILLPRLLPFLYEIRNNRGVGHVGGDVDPNYIDATAVLSCSKWIMAELVRVFHSVSLEEAQNAVDALIERVNPIMWEVDGIRRVLDPDLGSTDLVLMHTYTQPTWISEDTLRGWIEYKNKTHFKEKILKPLHKLRQIEYDSATHRVKITPVGSRTVEEKLLPKYR